MRYMLDTNICIYLMRHQPPEVAARFATLRIGDVVMSALTLAELCAGLQQHPGSRQRNRRALDALTELVPPLPFGAEAAAAFGAFAGAEPKRRRKDILDRLIAAHAASLGLVVVTNNERDFAGYPGLAVENWVAAP